jgi:tetratricopeptide (TPR) repeat protein
VRRAVFFLALCALSACAKPKPFVSYSEPAVPVGLKRLIAAHALVRAGCLDCLLEAHREYSSLATLLGTEAEAEAGKARAAALIAIRQAELGMVDEGFWKQAEPSRMLDLVRTLTPGPVSLTPVPDPPTLRRLLVDAPEPLGGARAAASEHELSAYLWLSLACGPLGAASVKGPDRLAAVGEELSDTQLIIYKEASGCPFPDTTTMQALLNGDARFKEAHYFLGNAALTPRPRAGIPPVEPNFELADDHFRQAYEWRPNWPGLTLPMAILAMSVEDFPRALEFYDKTLGMVPGLPDGHLGRVRALTYLGRHGEAIEATQPLLGLPRNQGDARYWRALNETQLDRTEEAWDDIERAAKVLVNVDVPKLAGIIAIRRKQFDVARLKLQEARQRQTEWRIIPPDCDIGFYLQTVLSEQGEWPAAAREAIEAAECFEAERNRLVREIDRLKASELPEERKARQLARREQQMHNTVRRNANARFNAAVANFYLQRREEALHLASTLVEDEQFGERARLIVSRTQP